MEVHEASVEDSGTWKLPWTSFRGDFHGSYFHRLPRKLPSVEASGTWKLLRTTYRGSFHGSYFHGLPRKLPWKLLARPWKHVKAIHDILPLRHLHGSFNGFHGTRGSFHGYSHGLPPKRNNRAENRMYFTLTLFHVVSSMEFKPSTVVRTEDRRPGRPGVAHVHGQLL